MNNNLDHIDRYRKLQLLWATTDHFDYYVVFSDVGLLRPVSCTVSCSRGCNALNSPIADWVFQRSSILCAIRAFIRSAASISGASLSPECLRKVNRYVWPSDCQTPVEMP